MRSIDERAGLDRLKIALAAVVAIGTFGVSSAAMANDVIDDCGQSCEDDCGVDPDCREAVSGKCKLTADVSCDDTESAIVLVSGNDLEMQGYDITCTETSPDTCGYGAILMNDTGSTVTSDGSGDDGEAMISGRFTSGVNCGAESNSTVEKITIFDGLFGVVNCKTVKSNVIGPSSQTGFGANFGISTSGISNADSFSDNYISGRVVPIFSNGTTDLDILRNVIHTDTSTQAIWVGTTAGGADGIAKFNVFFSDGFNSGSSIFLVLGTDSITYDGNFCDEDHPDCADCISDDRCESYESPFSGN